MKERKQEKLEECLFVFTTSTCHMFHVESMTLLHSTTMLLIPITAINIEPHRLSNVIDDQEIRSAMSIRLDWTSLLRVRPRDTSSEDVKG